MSLSVWYPEDITNALLAAEQAVNATAKAAGVTGGFPTGFLEGYRAALTTIAVAFGLLPRPLDPQVEEALVWLPLALALGDGKENGQRQ